MNLKTLNKKVACSLFAENFVKKSVNGDGPVKVGRIENKMELARLKVLAPNDLGLYVDSYVLVRADRYTQQWAKEVFTDLLGERFILVPYDQIEGVVKTEAEHNLEILGSK